MGTFFVHRLSSVNQRSCSINDFFASQNRIVRVQGQQLKVYVNIHLKFTCQHCHLLGSDKAGKQNLLARPDPVDGVPG